MESYMMAQRLRQEFDYDQQSEQWRPGFDTVLECVPEFVTAKVILQRDILQKEKQSCSRLKELLDAEIPIIVKHLETHRWLRHSSDASHGMINVLEQHGWLMRDMYCSTACPDRSRCDKITSTQTIATLLS